MKVLISDNTSPRCKQILEESGQIQVDVKTGLKPEELVALKKKCLPNCSSTCFYTMGYYYNLKHLSQWIRKHTRVG